VERQRVVLITGAASGIGAACAARLLADGYAVVGWDLRAGDDPRIRWHELDVRDASAVGTAAAALPALDGAVTCAGLANREAAVDIAPATFSRLLDVNVDGTFLVAQAAYPALAAGGGTLVTMGSVAGRLAFTDRVAYCASKAAVSMLTRCLAIEWGPHGVRAVCVCPGFVDVGMAAQGIADDAALGRAVLGHTPAGRLTSPAEVAGTVAFVLSDAASGITGSDIYVDGGFAALGGF